MKSKTVLFTALILAPMSLFVQAQKIGRNAAKRLSPAAIQRPTGSQAAPSTTPSAATHRPAAPQVTPQADSPFPAQCWPACENDYQWMCDGDECEWFDDGGVWITAGIIEFDDDGLWSEEDEQSQICQEDFENPLAWDVTSQFGGGNAGIWCMLPVYQ